MNRLVTRGLITCIILFCLLSVMAVSACATSPTTSSVNTTTTTAKPTEKQYGGILKIGTTYEPTVMGFPARMSSGPDILRGSTSVEPLLYLNPTGEVVPWLAESWKFDVENKSLILSLRKGVKFHDGTDFNADAVKFNLELCKSAKRPELQNVQSIDIVDNYTVRLVFSEMSSKILLDLTSYVGLMISPTAYKTHDQQWCELNPVGTGPFKFVSWQRDVKIVFTKFDNYWQKGKPYLDGMEYIKIADPVVGKATFLAGDIDMLDGLSPLDVKDLEAKGIYKLKSCTIAGFGMAGDSNNAESPFANVLVRQSIANAIDRQAIVKNVVYGYYTAIDQFATPDLWSYNPNIKDPPYDPQKAKQLLSQAGYPNGFKTKLTVINAPAFYMDMFTAVQGYLKTVGIDAEIESVTAPRWLQLLAGGWNGLIMVSQPGMYDPCAVTYGNAFTSKGTNHKSIKYPADYEAARDKANATFDTEAKKKLTWETQRLFNEEYRLVNLICATKGFSIRYQKVNDDGFWASYPTSYTPADAWMGK